MKKCSRCQVFFKDDERLRCLYCDTSLWTVENEETTDSVSDDSGLAEGMQAKTGLIEQIIKSRGLSGLGRMQLIVGNYFRRRTFHFIYNFCRNEYKHGKAYSRGLIQPLNITSFLAVPWVLWDFLDTALFRLTYNGFCEKCQTKYRRASADQPHDPEDCTYCREYSMLVDDILTGRITQSEPQYKQLALQKVKMGKRSAYHDLCGQRTQFTAVVDIFCIWASIFVWVSLFVVFAFPQISIVLSGLAGGQGLAL